MVLHTRSPPYSASVAQIAHFVEKDIAFVPTHGKTSPHPENTVYTHYSYHLALLTLKNPCQNSSIVAPLSPRRHTLPRPARTRIVLHFHIGIHENHPIWELCTKTSLVRGLATISDPNKNSIPTRLMTVRAPPHRSRITNTTATFAATSTSHIYSITYTLASNLPEPSKNRAARTFFTLADIKPNRVPILNCPRSQNRLLNFQILRHTLLKTQHIPPHKLSIIPSPITSQPKTVPWPTTDKIYGNKMITSITQPGNISLRTFQNTPSNGPQLKIFFHQKHLSPR